MAAARRGFLKAVAIAPLTPAALVGAQAPPAPAAGKPVAATQASGSEAIADGLTEVVRREHGGLDADALARIRKRILRRLEGAERLRRAARLGNADGPVTAFDPLPPGAPEQRR